MLRPKVVLGWTIAAILAGDAFTLAIHVEDKGPHIFEALPTTTSTTTDSTTTTSLSLSTSTSTSSTTSSSTTTSTTLPGATTTTIASPPAPVNPLVGNTFLVQSATFRGENFAITSRLTITFSQDGSQATAYWDRGCNPASAPVVIRASTIDVGEITSTTAGCPSDQPADTFFVNAIMASDPKWTTQGDTIVFEGADRSVTTKAL